MYDRAQQIFEAALEVQAEQRASFVEERCGNDAALRGLVLALLAADEYAAGDFLGGASEHPREIGPFRLVEVVGEGGMGTVFRAEQREPIERTVAIKIVRAGFESAHAVARFGAERRALARMEHPNIARVLDAGVTGDGRPFVAMELVDGVTISRFVAEHALDVAARVRLWVQVCEAVQHAHQKGVLHRDIKPSNVLVTVVDGRPVPKVIDFGLARALDEDDLADAGLTRHGQVLGTPNYMSPEQAASDGRDVDSRTDIYALGVLGYELLTGAPPLANETVARKSWAEIVRLIQERPAARPSERVAEPELRRQIRGDLDSITQKALEKDRDRRYSSASELAADLERHLRREPVVARPPSLGYVARRFVARHRLAVTAAVALALTLVSGLAATAWQAVRATQAESRERDLRVRAERSQRVASSVNDFLVGVFRSADPRQQGKDVKVADRLAIGVEQAVQQFDEDPEVAAEMLAAIGVTYRSLSMLDEAESALGRALEFWGQAPAVRLQQRAFVLNSLGILNRRRGRPEAAVAMFRRSLADHEANLAAGALSDEHVELTWDSIAKVSYNLAMLLSRTSDIEDAERLLARCVAINREYFPEDQARLGIVLSGQGQLYLETGQLDLEQASYEQALACMQRAFEQPHPYLAVAYCNLCNLFWRTGDYDAMDEPSARGLAIAEQVFGPDHEQLPTYLRSRSAWLVQRGKAQEAEPLLRRALEIEEASRGKGTLVAALISGGLARCLLATDADGALEWAIRGAEGVSVHLKPDSVMGLQADLLLALARLGLSQDVDVSGLDERVRSILEGSAGVAPGDRQRMVDDLARIRMLAGK